MGTAFKGWAVHAAWRASVVAALGLAGLAGCGGGGGSAPTEPPPANAAAIATAQPGELLSYVRRKLAARGPQGATASLMADGPGWLTASTTSSGAVSRTGSVVQEAGVDEDDLLKTDGTRIYTLQALQAGGAAGADFARLAIYTQGVGGKPQAAGSVNLATDRAEWVFTRGMLLADGLPRLAVVGEGAGNGFLWPGCGPAADCVAAVTPYRPVSPTVHLHLLDATQVDKPGTATRLVFDGRLVGTRQIGRMLYVVASHSPFLAFDQLPTTATEAERAKSLAALTVADIVPKISVNGGTSQPLLAETDCWLQKDNASSQVALTTITAIDLGSPSWARSTRCFAGGSDALYMSAASVYLATSRNEVQTANGRLIFTADTFTDVHKFAVSGASIAYRGSGTVKGHLGWDRERTPYRLSEHNGDLRVLSFTGTTGWIGLADAATLAASPATLTVLRERASDASLQAVATLPNSQRPAAIGKPGEQLYGVRFVGDRGYAVTFRRTDPLYVLDLSNPADPRMAGVLEVPGFSDWLFPLDGGLLFGVGKDADERGQPKGVKVALFDVRDAANPKLVDTRTLGRTGTTSGLDYSAHGLTQLTVGSRTRLALPVLAPNLDDPALFSTPEVTLQRFEVDSTARTLTVKPAIDLARTWVDLGSARSLLQGDLVYHLSEGNLRSWAW